MLALIYVGLFAVIGFFARLDITQTALFSLPTFAKMLDAPPPPSDALSNLSVITASPDNDAVTIAWREWVTPTTTTTNPGREWVTSTAITTTITTTTPIPTPAFRLVCPLNGASHGIIPGVTTCEVRSTSATMADEGVSWPGEITSLELGTPSLPVVSAVLLTSLLLGVGLLVVCRCLLLVLGYSLAEMHAPQQEQTARPAAEATPKTRLLTRCGTVDTAGDLTTRELARPPTSAETEGSEWVSHLCAERAASVAGEEQQEKKKEKQPPRACWKGERAEGGKPALRRAVHWEGVEEEGTPAGGPLQVPRTVNAADGKRADTKAPGHPGGDAYATPRSTISPAVEVQTGPTTGSKTVPGGGRGAEKARRGGMVGGTRGVRSARARSGVPAESRRWRVGKKCQRKQLHRQCELVATLQRYELRCARLAARRQHLAPASEPPPPPASTPHSASAPAAPGQTRIGGPMSWEPTDEAVDALAWDFADISFLAPGEHAIDMEGVTCHSTAPAHPEDIVMEEVLPNPAPATEFAAPLTGDVCMADVAQNTAPDVEMADDAVPASGVAIPRQAMQAVQATPIYQPAMFAQRQPHTQAAWPSQEVQAAQAARAVQFREAQASMAALVTPIHQAPMPPQQQPRTNRQVGAAKKSLGGSPLRSTNNGRRILANVPANAARPLQDHEMLCPRQNCRGITFRAMPTCQVCGERKPGAETSTFVLPDYQRYGSG
ncbi:hypothetical protein LTR91_001322 [Friedmanniomyces endolithicus]|uniref:Uncharacterized protein n=1 Tax=Friedmanniomyces endolithicus TaxID=329885 RepID=A0AAN6L032_9PEZI|nr:hypothetical protein LTR57_001664 [Friedmanniomyces endolithicus]KAK1013000.1 hypothetical protein LTS01_000812 [Friedmanniomyces endolithicus]KAK1013725.1 hypothetical protein LTR91_001322 [Friedmanniomyces endolithicus]KAK1053393.1 hypothetical protein LTS16_001150 [Friedmanniomyces endolithicus]